MNAWQQHLVIVPVVLPLAAAAVLLAIDERRRALKRSVAFVCLLALLGAAVALVRAADQGAPAVYRVGDWPAPFGIVLVADRLSAVMVLLAAVLGLAAFLFACTHWDRAGPRFHSLLQVLLMGVDGAFLTGDLFNLFVFFEVLLAASYGLALHGSGAARVQASLHYIVVNLTASLLFLIGAALIYGVTGTLNLADLGVRIPAVAAADRGLAEAGAGMLAVAFLVKAGSWPLCFWLPRSYGAACAPAAALFAILTKVGIYAVLRVLPLFFGAAGGEPASFAREWLTIGGLLTLTYGAIGVFGAQELSRLAGFSLIASCGTVLAAVGAGQAAVSGAALYYLIASTLGVSALFLLIELVERSRAPGADMLAITAEAFGSPEGEEREEVGVAIPGTWAVLGLSFVACALLLAGLPPLPGFVAKLALLDALLRIAPIALPTWVLLALLMFSGLATVIAASRTGVRIFWTPERPMSARVGVFEILPILILLGAGIALAIEAGGVMRYLDAAAQALHAPSGYIDGVLR
ncbi:MAG: monovalent cation/H+ antiporter subunit D [Proteobacteria bacterium]|jgi:multicomponent K+:H+ antiporter subunit D|nr:monovalent cation/H+ antiporter subunit D [Pseudomonadota bacterium]